MNDKDFDQIFSDKLNEVSEFSGADDNWQKLNFRLDLVPPVPVLPAPPVPTIGWHQGWLYAAMSALAVGNVWLWLQMRDVNRQNEALQKAVATVQANRKDTVYRIDTVYQKVYLIDNQSNSENSRTLTPAEYAALSANRVSQNRVSDAASSQSMESQNLKNQVTIEDKKQQNIDNAHLNRSAKSANIHNNTIAAGSKAIHSIKNVDKIVLNENNSTKSVDKVAANDILNGNPVTKSVDKAVSSNVSNENNSTKSIENTVLATLSKDKKSIENPTSNVVVATDVANSSTPSNTDLATFKAVDASEVQNKILNKTDLLLLPLDSKPLLPIEALEKSVESITVARTMQPIKVKKQHNIFSKLGMPEVNIGIIGAVGRSGKYKTEGWGIGTDIGLSRNWSIVASAEKHEATFEMRDRNKRFHLPNEPAGVPRDRQLMELEGKFKDFRLSLGAKYVFLTHKKFRPYVLAQHVLKIAPPSFVAFKYEKPSGEKEEYFERIEPKSFANIWQVGAGMTGDFNNRVSWNAGLNYMFDFNAANHNINPFTLRAGVYYRL